MSVSARLVLLTSCCSGIGSAFAATERGAGELFVLSSIEAWATNVSVPAVTVTVTTNAPVLRWDSTIQSADTQAVFALRVNVSVASPHDLDSSERTRSSGSAARDGVGQSGTSSSDSNQRPLASNIDGTATSSVAWTTGEVYQQVRPSWTGVLPYEGLVTHAATTTLLRCMVPHCPLKLLTLVARVLLW